MNSSQLRSSYQAYKLSIYNSPREYISVFAVRATLSLFAASVDAPFCFCAYLTPG
jgi:hypothetical protein